MASHAQLVGMSASTTTGRYAAATEGLLRDTVLATVGELAAGADWEKTSMARIAELAGVSRQSLYNEFGDRDGLIEAYVLSEAVRFLDSVETAVSAQPDGQPLDALRAAMSTILTIGDDHPVLRAVATGTASPKVLDTLVGGAGSPLHELAGERLAGIITARWPGAAEADVTELCDVVIRLMISHLTQSVHDPEGVADRVLHVLAPYIRSVFGDAN